MTICTDFSENLIGDLERVIIEKELKDLEQRFQGLSVDISVIMPDHIHIIFEFSNSNAQLFVVIQAFKSLTTRKMKLNGYSKKRFWQPNYFEHVIRNEKALSKIRKYIMNNSLELKLKMEEFYEK